MRDSLDGFTGHWLYQNTSSLIILPCYLGNFLRVIGTGNDRSLVGGDVESGELKSGNFNSVCFAGLLEFEQAGQSSLKFTQHFVIQIGSWSPLKVSKTSTQSDAELMRELNCIQQSKKPTRNDMKPMLEKTVKTVKVKQEAATSFPLLVVVSKLLFAVATRLTLNVVPGKVFFSFPKV